MQVLALRLCRYLPPATCLPMAAGRTDPLPKPQRCTDHCCLGSLSFTSSARWRWAKSHSYGRTDWPSRTSRYSFVVLAIILTTNISLCLYPRCFRETLPTDQYGTALSEFDLSERLTLMPLKSPTFSPPDRSITRCGFASSKLSSHLQHYFPVVDQSYLVSISSPSSLSSGGAHSCISSLKMQI